MKTAPINRWDYYKNLGTGIIAFGLIFNPVEFLEKGQKKKKRKGTVPAGPEQLQCSRPRGEKAQASQCMHQIFKPDGRGPGVRERERGEGEVRMTGGLHLSSLTSRQKGR